MQRIVLKSLSLSVVGSTFLSLVVGIQPVSARQRPIVHDAEYYILDAQHGQKWAVEDREFDTKLGELRSKYGTPPNIIHIMWDDTAVG